jgi:hypothetical protein
VSHPFSLKRDPLSVRGRDEEIAHVIIGPRPIPREPCLVFRFGGAFIAKLRDFVRRLDNPLSRDFASQSPFIAVPELILDHGLVRGMREARDRTSLKRGPFTGWMAKSD